jgi:probable HAF family extracellular repeat protein
MVIDGWLDCGLASAETADLHPFHVRRTIRLRLLTPWYNAMKVPHCSIRSTLRVAVSASVLLSLACADESRAPVVPTAPQFAKAASGPAVTAATPPYGDQGQVGEQVTITGSGFSAGAVPSWERNGVASTKVTVRQIQVMSSTQIVATIDIAADADLAFYDVAVTNSDRKKGIGTELFEVTTALNLGSLGGNTNGNSANDNGQVVGYTVTNSGQRAFYWSEATGMVDIGGTNALGIDQAGTTIVGNGGGWPLIWNGSGVTWSASALPTDPASSGGGASSVASDPATGVATIIGGNELFSVKHAKYARPRLWKRVSGGWQKVDLSMPYANVSDAYAWVTAVNANGQATGAVRQGSAGAEAVVWEANGSFTVLGAGGAPGINGAGTVVASWNSSGPVYYKRDAVGLLWTGPWPLPGGCTDATGMDDAGRIIARGCPIPGSTRSTSVVIASPYTTPVYLGGLGDATEGGTAYGISRNGTYIAGTAPTKPSRFAVRWQNPLF